MVWIIITAPTRMSIGAQTLLSPPPPPPHYTHQHPAADSARSVLVYKFSLAPYMPFTPGYANKSRH